jgi:hypothetical protein
MSLVKVMAVVSKVCGNYITAPWLEQWYIRLKIANQVIWTDRARRAVLQFN